MTRERDRLRAELKTLADALVKAEARTSLLERVDRMVVDPPDWTVRLLKGGLHRGILGHCLSDCHFDEVVKPSEVEGINAFNRTIAVQRLKRDLERLSLIPKRYFAGVKIEGFVLVLGGDLLSGAIHEELVETNEDTVYGSLDFWTEQLVAFIGPLADRFGKVHVVGIVGNHGRRTRKPVHKRRVRDNLDWLMYRMVSKFLKGDDRITWQIPESTDADFSIYTTRFRATHGDQFHGGSGIAGMLSPIMLGQHRKAQQQMALGKMPFDWLVIHHWHQYLLGRGVIVNGALKGYDEYAFIQNYRPEPPQQAFWLTTPEHGVSFAAPVFCGNRKAEGW